MSQHDYSFTRAVGALPVQNPNAPKKSKKELEEIRKREEEVAAATAYEEFVASFDEPAKLGKTFVRGTTFNAGTREEKNSQETGKLYRPTSKIAEAVLTRRAHSPTVDDDRERNEKGRKKEKDKKKSNLELFKEELKIIQEEREERHRLKTNLKETVPKPEVKAPEDPFATIAGISRNQGLMLDDIKIPQFNLDDQTTTNIYLGNVNPKMSEQQLCEIFGRYGPLASIKIMWPRSDEEKARGRNCGFVAFMNRKDGERAMKALNGREIMQYEMKLGWGKAVPIPAQPIYIPPLLLERTLPPPPSGLPFNGQPSKRDRHKIPAGGEQYVLTEENEDEFRQILISAVVKVVVPTERNLLSLIHRMIEFVVREGPMFEAMIMNREINNPVFRFLFENQSPAHVYYRWKLYSILHGDSPSRWRTTDFRMFKNGSIWRPPPINPYTQGMPEELVEKEDLDIIRKGQLSNAQRERFEDMLRTITLERQKIADIMIYCIEHAEAAEEVCDCVTESLSNHDTSLPKKVARLYLVSDILHNCSAKITNVSYYRKGFQEKLPQIFKHFHEACKEIEARLKAEQFKQKVMGCFRSWEEWAIYPSDFLIKLQNIFLGLVPSNQDQTDKPIKETSVDHMGFSYDGAPLEDDDGIDREGPIAETPPRINDDELDGVPINDDDLDGVPLDDLRNSKPAEPKVKFAQSKWETVDPSVIEAQAMTTSKWDLLDQDIPEKEDHYDNNARETDDGDLDGQPMDDESQGDNGEVESERGREARENLEFFKMGKSEERRNKLREIELKVMKCQDELESGKRSRKSGMTISQQVAYYRHKLMKKERLKLELKDSEREKQARRERRDSSSPELKERSKDRDRYRGRSRSSSRSPVHKKIRSAASKRHRSRSPEYRLRASSPSPPRSSSKSHKTKKSRH